MNVAVAVPVYNGGEFFCATLESIAAQTYQPLSVTIYNNGSTDGTGIRAAEFIGQKGLRGWNIVNSEKPGGMTNDWNKALSGCGGDLVKLLPADDLISPDCISRQVAIMEAFPEVGFVVSKKNLINSQGRRVPFRGGFCEGKFDHKTMHDRLLASPMNMLGEPGAGLMRRSIVEQIGLFDPQFTYYPDLDYWLRLLAASDGYYLRGEDYFFRIHGGSLTVSNKTRATEEFVALGEKHRWSDGSPIVGFRKKWRRCHARVIAEVRSLYLRFLK